jgi:hypothetical protein
MYQKWYARMPKQTAKKHQVEHAYGDTFDILLQKTAEYIGLFSIWALPVSFFVHFCFVPCVSLHQCQLLPSSGLPLLEPSRDFGYGAG